MASTYKTPGVYVEEISTFPPSVAEVETAIPAFIGYTQKASRNGKDLKNKPTRISSLLQFAEYFGGAPDPEELKVTLDDANAVAKVDIKPKFYLYNSMRLFFANGGGDCYIVSVGDFDSKIGLGNPADAAKPGFLHGLKALEKYDEPTLILFPDAVLLADASKLGTLQQQTLKQCNTLQDRFGVFDVFDGNKERTFDENDIITKFRDSVGINYLKYGAAYFPWVETTLNYEADYSKLALFKKDGTPTTMEAVSGGSAFVKALDNAVADKATLKAFVDGSKTAYTGIEVTKNKAESDKRAAALHKAITDLLKIEFDNADIAKELDSLKTSDNSPLIPIANKLLAYDLGYPEGALAEVDPAAYPASFKMGAVVKLEIFDGANAAEKAEKFRAKTQELYDSLLSVLSAFSEGAQEILKIAEQTLRDTNPTYSAIIKEIAKEAVVVPASGPTVGLYAAVDNDRGVWKAPANVSLSTVSSPTVMINSSEQEDLNVDTTAGKSINAIRYFTGKGTLIWGARTLAGNDNEWRYVPVRRFYNMVEESVRKSTGWAVFEPNDANLWVKVKAMIENYLIDKWREGALAGSKPEQAFFVNVGLGKTMSAQDILEGRLIIEIGMAAVRPAEFIILRFSHKMQEV